MPDSHVHHGLHRSLSVEYEERDDLAKSPKKNDEVIADHGSRAGSDKELVDGWFRQRVSDAFEDRAAGIARTRSGRTNTILALYCRYLSEAQGEGADPAAVDSARLRRYSAWLTGQGFAASTVARRLASLRSYLSVSSTAGAGGLGPVGWSP